MPRKKVARRAPKSVETLTHDEASRPNIPTAEQQSLAELEDERSPRPPVRYPRARPLEKGETRERDEDLDPQIVWNGVSITLTPEQVEQLRQTGRVEAGDAQLVWRGKDTQDWTDLVVDVPPLYVQETINPKSLIDALKKDSERREPGTPDLFETLRVSEEADRTEFYQHEQGWTNRMILGDSLQVMASLAERERLRGKVQAIYFDPPYGIKFNSNWQVSTRSRDVKDGKMESMSREPEQVKAFRDTWKDGIHSYLTYLRDRLTVMRDLLTESGSIFVQIGDENVHRVRALMDEVYGEDNFVSLIGLMKTSGLQSGTSLPNVLDYIVQYAKNAETAKFRPAYVDKREETQSVTEYVNIELPSGASRTMDRLERQGAKPIPEGARPFETGDLTKPGPGRKFDFHFQGRVFGSGNRWWGNPPESLTRLGKAGRLRARAKDVRFRRFLDDFPIRPINNFWTDVAFSSRSEDKIYVVQTASKAIQRCLLMTTDPGDLVLDPTCGSGTTAAVAECWGRRWITIDTSRVALALARRRLMSLRYPYFILADSETGRQKEAELTGRPPSDANSATGRVRQGFIYERAPHVTLKSIANNTEIDAIWEAAQEKLGPLLERMNTLFGTDWEEWEVPRFVSVLAGYEHLNVEPEAVRLYDEWWSIRTERQRKIDESIARNADVELLYDRPHEDKRKVRVAGPFTVESLSPHRTVPMDDSGSTGVADGAGRYQTIDNEQDFVTAILDNLKTSGVQQGAKEDRITFDSISPWPGEMVHAEGRFTESGKEHRAAICIGPEYGTLHRTDLTRAAREAAEARFDVLVCCAFNYDPHVTDLSKLGPMPIVKAKMNPDLHMAEDLRRDKNANLFMVIGEPDVKIDEDGDELTVTVRGLDVFKPQTGELRAGGTDDIAAWFIDTDYDEECFFVRHAYFLGAGDPYKSLKAALRAEIDPEAWESLYSDVSRPFPRPESGRIAVKVIDHFGDEVMKVISV